MARRKMLSTGNIEFSSPGVSFVGRFEIRETVPYNDKVLNKYTFKNEVGTFVLMGSTQLDPAMAQAAIGDMIEVTYKGTQPTSNGFSVKLFDVAVLEEDDDDEQG